MADLAPFPCLICGEELDAVHVYGGTHPACEPYPHGDDEIADDTKAWIVGLIKYADANSPRSLQTALGPSEIGTPCERRLAYRLANLPPVNHNRDPWPAIVGTAVHRWLEDAVLKYEGGDFIPESELHIDPALTGHSDLFTNGTVIDYKTGGPDVMREVRKHGPSRAYKIQTQLYGLGQQRAGREVNHVCLIYLPRAGWLSGIYVWVDKYRPEIAEAAIDRMYGVARGLIEVDIFKHPEVFNEIPAMDDHCGFCPYYRKEGLMESGVADETGCPGPT